MEVVGSVEALVVSEGLLWVCLYRDFFRAAFRIWHDLVRS